MLQSQENVKRELPRLTIAELLEIYQLMSPAQRVFFGREIGVIHVWQPKQRRQERGQALMLYRTPAVSTTNVVTGRNVAHAHRSKVELGLLGADLHLGNLALVRPTIKQSALLVGVCKPQVAAAIAIADDPCLRAAVLCGDVALFEAVSRKRETLAQHLARSSPHEMREAAAELGVEVIWDRMVSPLV